MTTRIDSKFAELRKEGRAALVTFITAGDPDYKTSLKIIAGLPAAGADVIEFGMPFTDPMADGPAIQAGGLRALKAGATMKKTLSLVKDFRKTDDTTPVVLMGYYNPIYVYGVERFLRDAKAAGADGLIVVDLPPEEDDELCLPAMEAAISTSSAWQRRPPMTSAPPRCSRTPAVSSIMFRCSASPAPRRPTLKSVKANVKRLRKHTNLPICVGFGVKTAEQARTIAETADGVVVGSALVSACKDSRSPSPARPRRRPQKPCTSW